MSWIHNINRMRNLHAIISEMLCKHIKTTGEDWHLYVNPFCYVLNAYVSLSTGYSAFELMYLHKPADLTQIDCSPLQHLSRSLDDYMKIMKKSNK